MTKRRFDAFKQTPTWVNIHINVIHSSKNLVYSLYFVVVVDSL